ncbi:MAG: hypothetical protein HY293_17570 [Planctomycetes bacterium]|nr:hypothetical protein [Planctomycetota bacterium]
MKRFGVVLPAALVLAAALARPRVEFPVVRSQVLPLLSYEPAIPRGPDLDDRFLDAWRHFNAGWYSSAEKRCRELLEAAPQDPRARDLLDRIPAARLDRLLHLKHSRGRLEMDSETLNDLSPDEWDEVVPRLVADAALPTSEGYPTVAAVHWALDTQKFDFAFDRWTLDGILGYIRDISGINLQVSAAVRVRVDRDVPLSLHCFELPLRQALRRLAEQIDPRLDVVVTEEKVVLIRDPWPPPRVAESFFSEGGRDILAFLGAGQGWESGEMAVDLDLTNVPITYILEVLRQKTGLDFRLAGTLDDEMISLKLSGSSLRATLALLLGPRNLVFAVEGSVVTIRQRSIPY